RRSRDPATDRRGRRVRHPGGTMTFGQIPAGVAVFLDANVFVYHFTNDPKYGAACTQLLNRTTQQQVQGLTSTDALGDVAQRLMTLEAISLLGWPTVGVAARLRKHHDAIPKLTIFRQAISEIPSLGIQVVPISQSLLETATLLSQQHELLIGD